MTKFSKQAIRLAKKNGNLEKIRKQLIVNEVRKVYDIDDEFAILRQADAKPDEYAEYFAYVEECKKTVSIYLEDALGK